MTEPGHNKPPGMIETAEETTSAISSWMAENPVIESEEQAKEAKLFLDRGKLAIEDMEDERDKLVRPLNETVKAINDKYRPVREGLDGLVQNLWTRIRHYLRLEEQRKQAIALEEARRADELRQAAEKALQAKEEAEEAAKVGELGVDLAPIAKAAQEAVQVAKVAERTAARAERETAVKVSGGFTRAIGLRSKEEYIVTNAVKAIEVLGATDEIKAAIVKAARAYRKLHNQLPAGVVIHTEDGI